MLHRHGIAVLADVRSAPYSRFAPDFDRGALRSFLAASDVRCVYFGDELGGRPTPPATKTGASGTTASAASRRFAGIWTGSWPKPPRIASPRCARSEPLHCHRTLLVAHALDRRGVEHILADGSLASHAAVMDDLLAKHNLSDAQTDLFPRTRDERVEEAVARQAREVGFARGEGRSQREPGRPFHSPSPQPRRTAT